MISDFHAWAANCCETNSLTDLKGATVAIEASYFLNGCFLRIAPPELAKEPLPAAIGGLPLALEAQIEREIEILRSHTINPIFIFDGIEVGKKLQPFKQADDDARTHAEAWTSYMQQEPTKAVATFGRSGYVKMDDCCRLLQTVLCKQGIEFLVAPYSAWGQLAYLNKYGRDYVDAIAGSSEILLYDVDKVITELDLDASVQQFTWVERQRCIAELGIPSPDTFVDACLLAGSALLPPLPTVNQMGRQHPRIKVVVNLLKANKQSGIAVCAQYQDDPAMQRTDYIDQFRRARLAIKHQVVLTSAGKIEPLEPEKVPSDLHEVIGQRLPDELYYYISIGAVGTRAPSQLTHQQIIEPSPPDGGESDDYRMLVAEKMTPMRTITLSLLANSIHRAYQHRSVKLRCWFDPTKETDITPLDVATPRDIISKWNVHEDVFSSHPNFAPDNLSLAFALEFVKDAINAAKTITPRSSRDPTDVLKTYSELKLNTIWRFLHLRGYIDDKHELTSWGKVLEATLAARPRRNHEQAAFIAVELHRLDLLTSQNMFPSYAGAPTSGSDQDKRNILLLSRIACLLKLQHEPVGYVGPLSRHLLGYRSMVDTVQAQLRDLVEMCFATLLLNGDAVRDSPNLSLSQIGLSLPFLLPIDCSLGVAMKWYLDYDPTPKSNGTEKEAGSSGPHAWFPKAEDLEGDLESAFALWDAVYAGAKTGWDLGLAKDKAEKAAWEGINEWIKEPRANIRKRCNQ